MSTADPPGAQRQFERAGMALPSEQRRKLGRVWQRARFGFALAFIAISVTRALVWQSPSSLVIAFLVGITAIDAGYHIWIHQGREPLVSLLIDTSVMFLAMNIGEISAAAMGIPFAYTVVVSMLLLRAQSAAVVIVYAAAAYALLDGAERLLGTSLTESEVYVSGVILDVAFLVAIVGTVRVVFLIMNRDRMRRAHRIRMQEAIAHASRALLSGAGEEPIEDALEALLNATDATAVFVDRNVDDPELGLCTVPTWEALNPGISPDPDGMWDKVPWSELSGAEALAAGESHEIRVSDLTGSERDRFVESGVFTELDLPIMVNGRWWGIIGFTDVYEDRSWARGEQYLLVTAAEMIGAYLERVEAREELGRWLRHNRALAACAAALQRSDDDAALDEALAALLEGTDADYASIDVNFDDPVDGPSARIVYEAVRPGIVRAEPIEERRSGPHSDLPTETRALGAGRPVHVVTRELEGSEREILERDGTRSEVVLPISVSGEWAGSIAFTDYQEERDYTDLDIRILATAAKMIGVYWERGRARSSLEAVVDAQELRIQYETAIAACSRVLLMSGDESAVDTALEHLIDATGSRDVWVTRNVFDADHGISAEVVHESVDDRRATGQGAKRWFDHRTGVIEQPRLAYNVLPDVRSKLEQGAPALVIPETLPPHQRRVYGPDACASELNIPIMAEGRWLGTIGFADHEGGRSWGEGEMAMLQTVAEMVGAFWERNESRQRLEELVRSKDEFVASVSHELRTPLSSVVGLSQELRDRREDFSDEEAMTLLSVVAEQSTEVADIIDDLLVAARADIGTLVVKPVPVNMDEVLASIMRTDLVSDFASVEIDGIPIAPFADPMRVRQILRNLVGNAARYGGTILRITTEIERSEAVIAVADDGDGVSEDQAQEIFEPYARAHSPRTQPSSVGLGLAVARDLARLMGGDISYRRVAGWTEFALTLPLFEDGPADESGHVPVHASAGA